eukprot:scaffold44_cov411-Prasinococcus_capsulatus_cf.AAC.28
MPCCQTEDPAMFVFHFGAERPCNTGCSSPQFTSSECHEPQRGQIRTYNMARTIPESAPVYYLGWDAAPSFSSGSFAVGISHPDADFKKFTLFTDLSDQGSFIVSTEWLAGWIEGGSSGSPLLLADTRKVIGTASAIDSCSFNQPCNGGCNSVAYYGDFATAFFQGGMRHILFGENEPFQTSMEASSTKSPETTENDDSNNQQPDDDVDDLGNPPVSEGCESFCGVQSDAGCWCDGLCSAFGDCCQDFAQVCSGASGAPDIVPSASPPPPSPPPPSPPPQYCLGKCGKPGNRQCIQDSRIRTPSQQKANAGVVSYACGSTVAAKMRPRRATSPAIHSWAKWMNSLAIRRNLVCLPVGLKLHKRQLHAVLAQRLRGT